MPGPLRRVPRPLAWLLALAAVVATVWSLALPGFQGPDESGHLTYVQRIGETGTVPFAPRTGGGSRDLLTAAPTEMRVAATWSGLEQLRQNPAARPGWSTVDERLWAQQDARLPKGARSDGNFNASFRNPPLYYLYATPAYLLAKGGSEFTRLQWVRWANLPLMLALVALTWLLAGELLGAAVAPRVLAAGLVALQPGVANVAGVAGPDLLLAVCCTGAVLAALRLVRLGPSAGRVGILALGVAAAALTQGRGLPMVVPAVLALVLAGVGARGSTSRRAAWALATGSVAAVLAGSLVVLLAPTRGSRPSVAGFLEYVWRFWTPDPVAVGDGIGPAGYGAGQAFVARLWGGFAQLDVELAGWAVTALSWLSLLLLAGIAAALWRRRAVRRRPAAAAVVAATIGATLAFLHITAYRSMLGIPSDPVITGRYLLPLLPLLAVGAAYAVHALPRRAAAPLGGAVLGLAVVLQLNGLALVVERFYA
jgi:hypothetical protein